MTAHEQMRAMLDQLMGTSRDGSEAKNKLHFTDSKVCKSFLLNSCPHDTLAGTRMDIGECKNIHDLALRADYEMASEKKDYYYEIDGLEHLEAFIKDCDRRTDVAKQKLKETQEELSAEVSQKLDQVNKLAEEIGKTLARAEELGAEGDVEEAQKMIARTEELKTEKHNAEVLFKADVNRVLLVRALQNTIDAALCSESINFPMSKTLQMEIDAV